jgi:hypothetical protein
MAAEEDVPLGDAARHYEQKFGDKVRQVQKRGAQPPAGPSGGGRGAAAAVVIVAFIVVRGLISFGNNSGRHSSPPPTFTTPPPQIDFEQQRKLFAELERLQREDQQRFGRPPAAPALPDNGPEPSYRFEENDLPLPEGLCFRVEREAGAAAPFNPGKRVHLLLDPAARELVKRAAKGEGLGRVEVDELRAALNEVTGRRDFYFAPCFADLALPEEARALADKLDAGQLLTEAEARKLNRLALEAAYPRQIIPAESRARLDPVALQRWKERAREDLAEARRQGGAAKP